MATTTEHQRPMSVAGPDWVHHHIGQLVECNDSRALALVHELEYPTLTSTASSVREPCRVREERVMYDHELVSKKVTFTLYPLPFTLYPLPLYPLYPLPFTLYPLPFIPLPFTPLPLYPFTLYPLPFTLYPLPFTRYRLYPLPPLPFTLYPLPFTLYPLPFTFTPLP